MRWFFLTVGYSGLAPKAPGTVGTIVSLPLGVLILAYAGSQTLFLLTILISLIAIKQIDLYERDSDSHDDKRIVIDELAGMWLALAIAPAISFSYSEAIDISSGIAIQIILSFIFFRVYDIKKPSIIGRIDREAKGGLGVVGDDLLAGVLAGVSSALSWQLIKLLF